MAGTVRPETADRYFSLGIVKLEEQPDGSVLVRGRPTQEVLDVDQQIADKGWFKKALPEWFHSWANVREMHEAHAVGVGKQLEWDEKDDPWLSARIVDPIAAMKCREGVYKGFSIGIKDPEIANDPEAPGGRIVGGKIVEVSVVDYPAVSSARFELIKSVGAEGWLNCQTGAILARSVPSPSNAPEPESGAPDAARLAARKALIPDPSLSDSTMLSFQDNRIDTAGDLAGEVLELNDHGALVRVGEQLWRVPFESKDGEILVGDAEPLPSPRQSEKTADVDAGKRAEADKEAVRVWSKAGSSFEDLRDRLMAAIDPPDPLSGRRNYNVDLVATYPDFCVVSRWDEGKYFRIPYEEKDGKVVLGKPEQVEQAFVPIKRDEQKVARTVLTKALATLGKSVWSTEYINSLPDDAFAYIAPGGKEDSDGKTTPRSLRHLPYKDKGGKVDKAHVDNAMARLGQTDIPEEAKTEAKRKLEAAQRELGETKEHEKVGTPEGASPPNGASAEKIGQRNEHTDEERESVYCPACGEEVPFESSPGEGGLPAIETIAGTEEGREYGRCAKCHGDLTRHVGKDEMRKHKAAMTEKGTEAEERAVSAAIKAVEEQINEARDKLRELKAKQSQDEGGQKTAAPDGEAAKGAMRNDAGDPERHDPNESEGANNDAGIPEMDEIEEIAKAAALAAVRAVRAKNAAPTLQAKFTRLSEALKRAEREFDKMRPEGFGNDGGPDGDVEDITGRGEHLMTPEFRSAVRDIEEAARAIDAGGRQLNPGRTKEGSQIDATIADRARRTTQWNLVDQAGKGTAADLGKAVSTAVSAALAPLGPELAKSVGVQLEKAVAPLVSRLEKVEHMAVPPRHPLTVAERPDGPEDGATELDKMVKRAREIAQMRDAQERAGGSVFTELAVQAAKAARPLRVQP